MKSILVKLKEDEKLDVFYDMKEEEQEKYLAEILHYANSNENEFKKYCSTIEPTEFCPLSPIYQALSIEWSKWGTFLTEEYTRIYKQAKKTEYKLDEDIYDYTTCLEDIEPEENNQEFLSTIFNLLAKDLTNELVLYRHHALWLMSSREFPNDSENKLISLIKEKLSDSNWKVRTLASEILEYTDKISKEEIRLSLFDRLRKKISFSYKIEVSNKTESGDNKSHKLAWLEYLSIAMAAWFIFYPYPYKIVFTILLILPIVGLILNGLNNRPSIASLVKITKNDDGSYEYEIADFIDVIAWVILLKVIFKYEFESIYSLAITGGVAACLMLILLYATHQFSTNEKFKRSIYFRMILNILIYSYGATYGVNCIFDNSNPKKYEVTVIDKRTRTSSKSGDTYYLKVNPWGHHYDNEEISVSLSDYESTNIGNKVEIDLKEGLLGIPWFYVDVNKQISTSGRVVQLFGNNFNQDDKLKVYRNGKQIKFSEIHNSFDYNFNSVNDLKVKLIRKNKLYAEWNFHFNELSEKKMYPIELGSPQKKICKNIIFDKSGSASVEITDLK